jgi:hypothetical protein
MSERSVSKLRRARWAAAVFTVAAAGGLVAGCGGSPAASSATHSAVLTSSRTPRATRTSSKQVTLPQCGAARDPFDPTDSAPPAGATTC